MKSKYRFVAVISLLVIFLTGCPGPEDFNYKSANEILVYMRENFEGKFTEVEHYVGYVTDQIYLQSAYGSIVKMDCEVGEKTFSVVAADLAESEVYGWHQIGICTNYYISRYADEIKQYIIDVDAKTVENYFGEIDYKIIVDLSDTLVGLPDGTYETADEVIQNIYGGIVRTHLIIRGDFLNDKDFIGKFNLFTYDTNRYNEDFIWYQGDVYVLNTADDISGLDIAMLERKYESYDGVSDDTTEKYKVYINQLL